MKSSLRHLAAILLVVVTALTATGLPAAPQVWEEVNAEVAVRSGLAQGAAEGGDGVELVSRDGALFLVLQRPMTVEVFTILGQPVSRATLKAGVHRLRLTSRGIYILRAGSVTRRVTI